jgi:hypothetical protein
MTRGEKRGREPFLDRIDRVGIAASGVRIGNLDNPYLRPANQQAKTPSGIFLQS